MPPIIVAFFSVFSFKYFPIVKPSIVKEKLTIENIMLDI